MVKVFSPLSAQPDQPRPSSPSLSIRVPIKYSQPEYESPRLVLLNLLRTGLAIALLAIAFFAFAAEPEFLDEAARLSADDPDYLELVRLEMSFVDQMRRIYTLPKRIAKVVLPPVLARRE